jgi:hypothetical protein
MRLPQIEMILACGMFCTVHLSAQWFQYPTPGVPRLANGKPNLAAPTPHTADGKPDLSGIWLSGNALPCPAELRDGEDCIEKIPLSHEAVDFGFSLKGGLPYQPWSAALVKQRVADLSKDDPHARCLPPNFPRAFAFPHLQKFIQNPGLLVILDEFNASYRQIFTDARPLPEDPQPSWNGYSSGKWDGDTLVVETIGFRDDLWLDMKGDPMTSAARVTERFRRPSYGSMEIQVTVNDPKAYTKPWTVTLSQTLKVDTELVDEICLENEKSVRHMQGK